MRFARQLQPALTRHLARGKSVLLLGPRQTGKTTLLGELDADLHGVAGVAGGPAALRAGSVRAGRRDRRPPAAPAPRRAPPLVTIDEVQKVPALMDVGQDLIDRRQARFVFTGSSARKLRRGREFNLLPGRVVVLRLDPLTIEERLPAEPR